MTVGTKSVLFGAHCFFLHPWFLAFAWWKLYGFKKIRDPYVGEISLWNWQLWVSFFVHDLGYWGKPNMDGPEGELHPELGANILFSLRQRRWYWFVLYHSRFLSKGDGCPYSILCVADKLAIALEPRWLYLPRVILSGEIKEYMTLREEGKYEKEGQGNDPTSRLEWFDKVQTYCRAWAHEHKDGKQDTWTEVT